MAHCATPGSTFHVVFQTGLLTPVSAAGGGLEVPPRVLPAAAACRADSSGTCGPNGSSEQDQQLPGNGRAAPVCRAGGGGRKRGISGHQLEPLCP